jgi:hypothetical protein
MAMPKSHKTTGIHGEDAELLPRFFAWYLCQVLLGGMAVL